MYNIYIYTLYWNLLYSYHRFSLGQPEYPCCHCAVGWWLRSFAMTPAPKEMAGTWKRSKQFGNQYINIRGGKGKGIRIGEKNY